MMRSAVVWAPMALMSVTTILAPREASSCAIAPPSVDPLPLTSATSPSISDRVVSLSKGDQSPDGGTGQSLGLGQLPLLLAAKIYPIRPLVVLLTDRRACSSRRFFQLVSGRDCRSMTVGVPSSARSIAHSMSCGAP